MTLLELIDKRDLSLNQIMIAMTLITRYISFLLSYGGVRAMQFYTFSCYTSCKKPETAKIYPLFLSYKSKLYAH